MFIQLPALIWCEKKTSAFDSCNSIFFCQSPSLVKHIKCSKKKRTWIIRYNYKTNNPIDINVFFNSEFLFFVFRCRSSLNPNVILFELPLLPICKFRCWSISNVVFLSVSEEQINFNQIFIGIYVHHKVELKNTIRTFVAQYTLNVVVHVRCNCVIFVKHSSPLKYNDTFNMRFCGIKTILSHF